MASVEIQEAGWFVLVATISWSMFNLQKIRYVYKSLVFFYEFHIFAKDIHSDLPTFFGSSMVKLNTLNPDCIPILSPKKNTSVVGWATILEGVKSDNPKWPIFHFQEWHYLQLDICELCNVWLQYITVSLQETNFIAPIYYMIS